MKHNKSEKYNSEKYIIKKVCISEDCFQILLENINCFENSSEIKWEGGVGFCSSDDNEILLENLNCTIFFDYSIGIYGKVNHGSWFEEPSFDLESESVDIEKVELFYSDEFIQVSLTKEQSNLLSKKLSNIVTYD